jgi:DNA polymerase-4
MRTYVRLVSATILHADVDAFFASVEQRDDPRLRGRPTIVGGGVVLAASYEARAYGVRGAMGGAKARRLCPHAVIVKPRFQAYVEASKAVFGVFEQTAPVVEGLSLEEAFLDVRGLEHISGSPLEIAVRLRRDVLDQVGLPITVGVATSKVVAKMASRAAKPDGLLAVLPGAELSFLHPLRVERLWGVGPATATKLHRRGILTVGDVARSSEASLVSILGRAAGRRLRGIARNRSAGRPRHGRGRRSIGSQSALGWSARTAEEVDVTLIALVDRVTRRMRESGRVGRTVVLRLRFRDLSRATRSHTLSHATAATRIVLAIARELLAAAQPLIDDQGLTLIGITVTNLERVGPGVQLVLPIERRSSPALDAALDELRRRFGSGAVTRAALLGRGLRPRLGDALPTSRRGTAGASPRGSR